MTAHIGKRLWIFASACALIVVCGVLVLSGPQKEAPQLEFGTALPPGKVAPMIGLSFDRTAHMIAPDGTLWCWGTHGAYVENERPKQSAIPIQVGTDDDWEKLVARPGLALALKSGGQLWGWGYSIVHLENVQNVQDALEPKLIDDGKWIDVGVGHSHCVALKSDGTIWTWGSNQQGMLGRPSRIELENRTSLTKPGPSLAGLGVNHASRQSTIGHFLEDGLPIRISEETWKAISVGSANTYALRGDGSLWRWGLDPSIGGTNHLEHPTRIGRSRDWISVSAGDFHLLALKTDGSLWIGGQNAHSLAPQIVPRPTADMTQIAGGQRWAEVISGGTWYLARTLDGSWWSSVTNPANHPWNASFPRVYQPDPNQALQPLPFKIAPWAIEAGGTSMLFLATDGSLWNWGERLGVPRRDIRFVEFKRKLNSWIWQLTSKRDFFNLDPRVIDERPTKIWRYNPTE